jgi:hypothetical protein
MQRPDDLYCKMYVDFDGDERDLYAIITSIIEGRIEVFTIYSNHLLIDIQRNSNTPDVDEVTKQDEFLTYKTILDVEPTEFVSEDDYIAAVSVLLQRLWDCGLRTVAACAFEENLPRKGGYAGSQPVQ